MPNAINLKNSVIDYPINPCTPNPQNYSSKQNQSEFKATRNQIADKTTKPPIYIFVAQIDFSRLFYFVQKRRHTNYCDNPANKACNDFVLVKKNSHSDDSSMFFFQRKGTGLKDGKKSCSS